MHPSDYLSQTETLFLIATVAGRIDYEESVYDRIPEAEKQVLLKAFEYFDQYKKMVLDRIDNRGKKRLMSRVKNYKPVLQCRSSIERATVPIDAWYDVICYIMELKCCNCRGKKRCRLRNILWDMQVPEAAIPDGENIICEYQYLDGMIDYKSKIE